jgi:integrase/recombinase XerD
VRRFLVWCEVSADIGRNPVLDRPTVNAFVADLLEGGAEPSTARSRHLALKRFSAWLADEEEIPSDELIGSKPPKLDQKIVPVLTEDQITKVAQGVPGQGLP